MLPANASASPLLLTQGSPQRKRSTLLSCPNTGNKYAWSWRITTFWKCRAFCKPSSTFWGMIERRSASAIPISWTSRKSRPSWLMSCSNEWASMSPSASQRKGLNIKSIKSSASSRKTLSRSRKRKLMNTTLWWAVFTVGSLRLLTCVSKISAIGETLSRLWCTNAKSP